jgi:hypothetical protein
VPHKVPAFCCGETHPQPRASSRWPATSRSVFLQILAAPTLWPTYQRARSKQGGNEGSTEWIARSTGPLAASQVPNRALVGTLLSKRRARA